MSTKYRGYEIVSGSNCYEIKKENKFIFSVQLGDNPQVEIDKYIEEEEYESPR